MKARHQPDETNDARVPPELAARLARGELTIADLTGLTREKLYEIAEVGFRLMNSGQLEQARAIYRGLIAASPFDSVFHCHLGAVNLRLGETGAAVEEYDAALRLNRSNVDAFAGRGEARLKRGEFAEAVTDLSAAIDLDREAKRPSTVRARALLLALTEAARQTDKPAR